MSRANKLKTEARVAELVRVILDGAQSFDLVEFVREQEKEPASCWFVAEGEKPLSYAMIRRYAVRAEEVIFKSIRTTPKRRLRLHLAKRRNLYAKSVSAGDYRSALAILDSEAKLEGLYAVVELDALARRIVELRQKVEELKNEHSRLTPGYFSSANGTGHPAQS